MKGQYNNAFLTCSWRFFRSYTLARIQIGQKYVIGFRKLQEKLENDISLNYLNM